MCRCHHVSCIYQWTCSNLYGCMDIGHRAAFRHTVLPKMVVICASTDGHVNLCACFIFVCSCLSNCSVYVVCPVYLTKNPKIPWSSLTHLSTQLSIWASVCLSIWVSVCLSTSLPTSLAIPRSFGRGLSIFAAGSTAWTAIYSLWPRWFPCLGRFTHTGLINSVEKWSPAYPIAVGRTQHVMHFVLNSAVRSAWDAAGAYKVCVHLNLRVYWALLEAFHKFGVVSDMHWTHSARGAVGCGAVLEWMEAQPLATRGTQTGCVYRALTAGTTNSLKVSSEGCEIKGIETEIPNEPLWIRDLYPAECE